MRGPILGYALTSCRALAGVTVLLIGCGLQSTAVQASVAVTGYMGDLSETRPITAEECQWRLPAQQFLAMSVADRLKLMSGCSGSWRIRVDGTIAEADAQQFIGLLRFLDTFDLQTYVKENGGLSYPDIQLDSEGGSIVAAIAMAKAARSAQRMREYTPMFMVLLRAKCHSACVILLAAGYQRMAAGSIGIHRPYFVGDEFLRLGYSDVKKAYDGVYGELASLFHSWSLSRTLIEDMFSIPSNEMRVLSERELDRYGLSLDDTVIVEQRNAETRAVCGMEAAASSADGFWWFTPEGNRCQDKIKEARRARAEASSTVADVPSGRGAPEHWSYSATLAFLVDCLAAYLLATRVNRAWIRILGAVGAGVVSAVAVNLLLRWTMGAAIDPVETTKRGVAGVFIHAIIVCIGIFVVRRISGKKRIGPATEG